MSPNPLARSGPLPESEQRTGVVGLSRNRVQAVLCEAAAPYTPTGERAIAWLEKYVREVVGFSSAIAGVTIQAGDRMVYDVQQTRTGGPLASAFVIGLQSGGGVGGGLDLEGNTPATYTAQDANWHHSITDMTSFAGQVMTSADAGVQGLPYTGAGTWDIWIANAAVVRLDGSVLPIFTGQSVSIAGIASTCGGNQQTFQTESTPVTDPSVTTSPER